MLLFLLFFLLFFFLSLFSFLYLLLSSLLSLISSNYLDFNDYTYIIYSSYDGLFDIRYSDYFFFDILGINNLLELYNISDDYPSITEQNYSSLNSLITSILLDDLALKKESKCSLCVITLHI